MKRWSDPISARREIEALFAEHAYVFEREDGGLPLKLEDCLWHMKGLARHDLRIDDWANATGLPVEFGRALLDYVTQFPGEGS